MNNFKFLVLAPYEGLYGNFSRILQNAERGHAGKYSGGNHSIAKKDMFLVIISSKIDKIDKRAHIYAFYDKIPAFRYSILLSFHFL